MTKTLISVSLLFISLNTFAQKVEIFVSISPAGSFIATSKKINGRLVFKENKILAQRITVPIDTFTTEVGLRDEHFKKYLKQSEYPRAVLTDLEGEKGVAQANLKVAGVLRKVTISYEIKDKIVQGEMHLNVKDFNLPKASYLEVGVSQKVDVKIEMPLTSEIQNK